MAVKIRLTRIGRHKDPFYRIVAADSRFARDGRYIEQIGYFDPDKGVENAVIDEELATKWLQKGAQPSDTVRAMFSRKGLLTKLSSGKKKEKAAPKKAAKASATQAEKEAAPKAEKAALKKTTTKKAASTTKKAAAKGE